MNLVWITLFALLITACDAFRDKWFKSHEASKLYLSPFWLKRPWLWWRWHMVKWTGFYSPLIVLAYFAMKYLGLKWYELSLLSGLMLFIWRRVYGW